MAWLLAFSFSASGAPAASAPAVLAAGRIAAQIPVVENAHSAVERQAQLDYIAARRRSIAGEIEELMQLARELHSDFDHPASGTSSVDVRKLDKIAKLARRVRDDMCLSPGQ